MEPLPAADEKHPARSEEDHPSTAKKKRGKRKKEDEVAAANPPTALDEAADVEAAIKRDVKSTSVANRDNHLNEDSRSVDGTPGKMPCDDQAAPEVVAKIGCGSAHGNANVDRLKWF